MERDVTELILQPNEQKPSVSSDFSSPLSFVYSLVAAAVLFLSSINKEDPSSILFSIALITISSINALVHSHFNKIRKERIKTTIDRWSDTIKNNANIHCKLVSKYGQNKEIPFYELCVGDVIIPDESLSFILDYISDPVCNEKNQIRIRESVTSFLDRSLQSKQVDPPIISALSIILHKMDVVIMPLATLCTIFSLAIAYAFSEPDEDYADQRFDIGVCILVLLPLFHLHLPLVAMFHLLCDNATIMYLISTDRSLSSFLSHLNWKRLVSDCNSINLSLRLSNITGVSAIDKKGILATSDPVIEKIFFLTYSNEEVSGEVLHVSSDIEGESITAFSFDDVSWHRFSPSILPLVESTSINGCNAHSSPCNCLCPIRQLIGYQDSLATKTDAVSFEVFRNGVAEEFESETVFHAQGTVSKEMEISRIHLRGSPSLLLPICGTYWDGYRVREMSDKIIRLISHFASRHCITSHCIALSCASIPNLQLPPVIQKNYEWMKSEIEETNISGVVNSISEFDLSQQVTIENIENIPETFLALISSQEQALPSIFEMIESLHSSCIRFILFSEENQLRSRIIAEKLGLEAGWNCHISLKNPCDISTLNTSSSAMKGRRRSCPDLSSIHSLPHSIPTLPPNIAQLPTGIQQIRPHLNEVDNVPLLVSLFTDSTVETTREMIGILQENRECELVLGSIHTNSNLITFMRGIFSIGVYPLNVSACNLDKKERKREEPMASLSADLIIHQSQISLLPSVLSFSRTRSSLIIQSLSFYFTSSISISLFNLLSLALLLPFPLSSLNSLILIFCLQPLLTLSISLSPDSTLRFAHPSSTLFTKLSTQFFFYHFPHLITLFSTYTVMLTLNGKLPCVLPIICDLLIPFSSKSSIQQIESTISFLRATSLIFASTPYIYPSDLTFQTLPIFNPFWSFSLIISLIIQFYFSIYGTFTTNSLFIFGFYIILSIISILIAYSYKRANIRIFRKDNRRRKFGFDTKLGMNSPY